jgi:hypothetical protein
MVSGITHGHHNIDETVMVVSSICIKHNKENILSTCFLLLFRQVSQFAT